MSTPRQLARAVSRNSNDIDGLYELLEGIDGKIVELKSGQAELKSGQEALETRVNDGFSALNERLNLLFTHLGIATTESGSTS